MVVKDFHVLVSLFLLAFFLKSLKNSFTRNKQNHRERFFMINNNLCYSTSDQLSLWNRLYTEALIDLATDIHALFVMFHRNISVTHKLHLSTVLDIHLGLQQQNN